MESGGRRTLCKDQCIVDACVMDVEVILVKEGESGGKSSLEVVRIPRWSDEDEYSMGYSSSCIHGRRSQQRPF